MNRTQLYKKLCTLKGTLIIDDLGRVRSKLKKDRDGNPACPLNALLTECVSNFELHAIRDSLGINKEIISDVVDALDDNRYENAYETSIRRLRAKLIERLGLKERK